MAHSQVLTKTSIVHYDGYKARNSDNKKVANGNAVLKLLVRPYTINDVTKEGNGSQNQAILSCSLVHVQKRHHDVRV